MKKLIFLLAITTLLPVVLVIAGHRWLHLWGEHDRLLHSEVVVQLDRGASLREFSRELTTAGLVEHPLLFELWVRLFSNYELFQAGRYRASEQFTIADLTDSIIAGKVYNPVVLQYTIPEGFTLSQIAARLEANGIGDLTGFNSLTTDIAFLDSLGIPAPSLEGYIYPATYSFSTYPDLTEAIRVMVQTFWDNLPKGYEAAVNERGLTLQEAVIFASLIELETYHDTERSLVSEVIWNRLKSGMTLGIDAALIYGIEDYDGDIKWRHLEDVSNLYNTRKHRGLPPGPIGSPSRKSLEAVLTPTAFGYFFYVLDVETGKHNFTKSLEEHNRYVQKLLRDTKKNKSR